MDENIFNEDNGIKENKMLIVDGSSFYQQVFMQQQETYYLQKQKNKRSLHIQN